MLYKVDADLNTFPELLHATMIAFLISKQAPIIMIIKVIAVELL